MSARNWHFATMFCNTEIINAQWLSGRASESRLRGPWFESYATVLKHRACVSSLHCSKSLSCINEYLAIDSGGYEYDMI